MNTWIESCFSHMHLVSPVLIPTSHVFIQLAVAHLQYKCCINRNPKVLCHFTFHSIACRTQNEHLTFAQPCIPWISALEMINSLLSAKFHFGCHAREIVIILRHNYNLSHKELEVAKYNNIILKLTKNCDTICNYSIV